MRRVVRAGELKWPGQARAHRRLGDACVDLARTPSGWRPVPVCLIWRTTGGWSGEHHMTCVDYFTPVSGAYGRKLLDMVEGLFAELTERCARRGSQPQSASWRRPCSTTSTGEIAIPNLSLGRLMWTDLGKVEGPCQRISGQDTQKSEHGIKMIANSGSVIQFAYPRRETDMIAHFLCVGSRFLGSRAASASSCIA